MCLTWTRPRPCEAMPAILHPGSLFEAHFGVCTAKPVSIWETPLGTVIEYSFRVRAVYVVPLSKAECSVGASRLNRTPP